MKTAAASVTFPFPRVHSAVHLVFNKPLVIDFPSFPHCPGAVTVPDCPVKTTEEEQTGSGAFETPHRSCIHVLQAHDDVL